MSQQARNDPQGFHRQQVEGSAGGSFDDDSACGPQDDDDEVCPECGAGFDEECDYECAYYEDIEDDDE